MKFATPFRSGRPRAAPRLAASLAAGLEYCFIDFYGPDGQWIDSMYQPGCADHVAPDMSALAARLAARPCAAVVLRHGHPSGRAFPSQEDVTATRAFACFIQHLGARLHDHVIEAGDERFSFRAAGLI